MIAPLKIASMIPRVSLMEIRLPVPFHPVFTRYAFCSALLHLLNQLFCILGRMQLQECLTEASGEGRGRLGNTALGTSQLSCETGQEVVLSLLRCQNRYWRKYAECICGQEDNVLSCRCGRNRTYDVLNMVDRVRYTGVLGYALISEIDLAFCIRVTFSSRAFRLDCIVDIRLGLLVQVDNLCVAAAFEVEYAVVIPAVLVITDQQTLRVCGQGGLTGSGKTEEDSGVLTVLSLCLRSSAWKRCPSTAGSSSSWRTYLSSSLRRTRC